MLVCRLCDSRYQLRNHSLPQVWYIYLKVPLVVLLKYYIHMAMHIAITMQLITVVHGLVHDARNIYDPVFFFACIGAFVASA